MAEPETRFDVTPSVGNHFAWIRTQLGMQRTLLAAVRTAVSLIGFGFTVAQFFQKLQLSEPARRLGPEAPRNLGLALIGAGVVSLAVFTIQYHAAVKRLTSPPYDVIAPPAGSTMNASTYMVAGVVIVVGIAAFFSVFLRF